MEMAKRLKVTSLELLEILPRGAIGGKTSKTVVLPGFCKVERGIGNGGAML